MYIMDCLYGTIEMDQKLIRCMLSPEIQRLRDIRLSNINSLLLTGLANVNRFEHSVGTAYLATVNTAANRERFSDEEADMLAYAALFHDLANGPFGHSYEYRVENQGFIPEERVGDVILEEKGREEADRQPFFAQLPNRLITMLDEKEVKAVDRIIRGAHPACSKILNNTIDIDNIDNVYRSAFHLGLKVNREAPVKLAEALYCEDGQVYFRSGAEPYLADWYETRRKMYMYLLLNPQDFAAKCMLEEAIDSTLSIAPTAINWQFTDSEFINAFLSIKSDIYEQSGHRPPEIITRMMTGDLYACIGIYITHQTEKYPQLSEFKKRQDLELKCSLYVAEKTGEEGLAIGFHAIVDKNKTRRALSVNLDNGETFAINESSNDLMIGAFAKNEAYGLLNGGLDAEKREQISGFVKEFLLSEGYEVREHKLYSEAECGL